LRPGIARELERRGVRPGECSDAASQVLRALTQTLADERGRWLLGPRKDARSEYRVRRLVGSVMHSYVMDRVFRDDKGVRWVADYRRVLTKAEIRKRFSIGNSARYEPQLTRYAAAVGGTDKTMVGLYFPLLAGWREWRREIDVILESTHYRCRKGAQLDILEVLRNRRSDRHFNAKPVAQRDVDLLIEAFRWAPSCNNRQPWRLVFATSADARAVYDDALERRQQANGRVPRR
jgi:hypothetical protein